ncbi:efflux RND transporter permease subunit [Bacteroides sp. 519]|uniref:efflux RND transporter permease subunit n=1 Tax=Bacteroides sp. 519 TaxID=2302937 RepID=UPI0013D6CEE2|nr:efflux RND transporter permease subunit [Bacteroides sp. 519]NDV58514.1 efflux RND transporter permease subunit [Bacteroides sp. 519]
MANNSQLSTLNSQLEEKRRISSFTLIVAFICVALVGLALIPLLPVKLNPSRSLPGFTVQFSMPGSSARVVEQEATSKLEAMLARIKGVRKMDSNSGNGWGNITIELDKHADIDAVRFEASTIIRQTWPQLPEEVTYPYIQMKMPDDNASRPFMTFTLNAPATPIVIQQFAEEHIKTRLAQIPGIYRINVSGATPMEWRLEYDSELLRTYGVTIQDIKQAVSRHYHKDFLGTCDMETMNGEKEWIRLTLVPEHDTTQFNASDILVTSSEGKLIKLDALVRVDYVEEEPRNYFRINGLNSIYLSITAEETANQLQLSTEVQNELQNIRRILPQGYEMHMSYNATEFIQKELDKIYLRTGLTVLILLVFVFIITINFKYLLLIVISLTINVAIAIIFYYLFGLEMQLYSLAGITVSLNLIIDNTIVMTDHILHRKNLKAFMSILAATLTTMGALVIIFFLDEKIRLNLQDFAAVVIISLAVSLFVALFLVPALIDKIHLRKSGNKTTRFRLAFGKHKKTFYKRGAVYFTRFYAVLIRFLCRWRIAVCVLMILLFGLPVFMLPDKLEGEGKWPDFYNKMFGSTTYKENIKPITDKVLGGSLRLFVQKVYEGSYFTRNEEVVLYINANLPNGSTLEQMNNLIKRMEIYLSEFKEIKQFQTSVYSPLRGSINIYFTDEHQRSGFPYTLKSNIISKALQLGGGSWGVFGLQDMGFSNDVRESAGTFEIKIYGYNYDELYSYAEKLKERLLSHRRIKEVIISSEYSWWKDDYQEFYFNLNKSRMAEEDISAMNLFASLQPVFGKNMEAGTVITENGLEKIKLNSRQSHEYDIWALQYFPFPVNSKYYKISELATVEKGQMPQKIAKENQQYRLHLQYEYIGSNEQGRKLQKRDLEEFKDELPMGYTVEAGGTNWYWNKKDSKQYLLLLVIIAIIFFISSILFNSLKQPLAIIFVIPVSYIGVFLTFYWFKLNFDQGGFAAFVLLCGITVNASIYILNEFNSIRRRIPNISPLKAYTKAWNAKVMPIFLTVVSTILGFIPFMVGTDKESFWFPLAAGTIGGLVMSLIGLFFLLPVLTLKKRV